MYQAQLEKEAFDGSEEDTYPRRISSISTKEDGRPLRIGPYTVNCLRLPHQLMDSEMNFVCPDCKSIVCEYLGDFYHGHSDQIQKASNDG